MFTEYYEKCEKRINNKKPEFIPALSKESLGILLFSGSDLPFIHLFVTLPSSNFYEVSSSSQSMLWNVIGGVL